jgi:hypothetical protein
MMYTAPPTDDETDTPATEIKAESGEPAAADD